MTHESQNIKVLNKSNDEIITKTFQEWMNRAVEISNNFNTDFEYLEVVK